MTLFKHFRLRDFAKERYLLMAKTFPRLHEERTQAYFMLSLTFLSLAILGFFAISPTISTIVGLNKKLDDSVFVSQSLKDKMNNLSSLHTQYDTLQSSWPVVEAAVPSNSQTTYVVGQIQRIAKQTATTVKDIQIFQVELSNLPIQPSPAQASSFTFSATVGGTIPQLLQFLRAITQFDRVVSIESIELTNENKQQLTIRARAFFTP